MKLLFRLNLILCLTVLVAFSGCSPSRKTIASKQVNGAAESEVKFKDITTSIKETSPKVFKPYEINTGKTRFKVGLVKFKNIEYFYNKSTSEVAVKGHIDVYNDDLSQVMRSWSMDLVGNVDYGGFANLKDKNHKNISALVTCLRSNTDSSYTCEDLLIEIVLKYRKQHYTEQLQYIDKDSAPAQSLRSEHLPPQAPEIEDDGLLDVADEGDDAEADEVSVPKIVSDKLSEEEVIATEKDENEIASVINPTASGRMVGRLWVSANEIVNSLKEDDEVSDEAAQTVDDVEKESKDEVVAVPDSFPPAPLKSPDEDANKKNKEENKEADSKSQNKKEDKDKQTEEQKKNPIVKDTKGSDAKDAESKKETVDTKSKGILSSIINVMSDFDGQKNYKLLNANSILTSTGDVRPFAQVDGLINRGKLISASNLVEKRKSLNDLAYFKLSALERKRYYGSFELVEFIPFVAKYAREVIPDYVLRVSDLSQKNGGPFVKSSHKSHQNGLDVDLAYLVKNPHVGFRSVIAKGRLADDFLIKENFDFFMKLTNNDKTRVTWIFTDQVIKNALCKYAKSNNLFESKNKQQVIYMLSRLHHSALHDDHFHVRIACTKFHPRCDHQPARAVTNDCPK